MSNSNAADEMDARIAAFEKGGPEAVFGSDYKGGNYGKKPSFVSQKGILSFSSGPEIQDGLDGKIFGVLRLEAPDGKEVVLEKVYFSNAAASYIEKGISLELLMYRIPAENQSVSCVMAMVIGERVFDEYSVVAAAFEGWHRIVGGWNKGLLATGFLLLILGVLTLIFDIGFLFLAMALFAFFASYYQYQKSKILLPPTRQQYLAARKALGPESLLRLP